PWGSWSASSVSWAGRSTSSSPSHPPTTSATASTAAPRRSDRSARRRSASIVISVILVEVIVVVGRDSEGHAQGRRQARERRLDEPVGARGAARAVLGIGDDGTVPAGLGKHA